MASTRASIIGDALERFVEKIVTNIARDVTNQLYGATPVNTGFARSNWIPSIGRPRLLNLVGVEPTSSKAAASRTSQTSALAGLRSYKLSRGSVYIVNNVPYIIDLNRGSSRKAPAAFVQRAIAAGVLGALRGLSR